MNQQSIFAIALGTICLLVVGCQDKSITSEASLNKPAESSVTVKPQNNAVEAKANFVEENSLDNFNLYSLELDSETTTANSAGSSLTGKVSDLEGLITDLNGRVSESEIIIPLPTDVLFDFDRSDIRRDGIPTLEKLGQAIADLEPQSVKINGHTDSQGSESYNLQLSQERAQAVATWLSNNTNISGDRLTIKGYGESQPLTDNEMPNGQDNPAGRAKNRRVELIIPK